MTLMTPEQLVRRIRQFCAPGTGKRRAGAVPERIEVPLRGLGGPRQLVFAEAPAHGAAVTQAFRHCAPCGGDTAVVLHGAGAHRCHEGHLTITTAHDRR